MISTVHSYVVYYLMEPEQFLNTVQVDENYIMYPADHLPNLGSATAMDCGGIM
jgi:hypothetical protein